jgi:(p)ppGpp synthase/HD superfamily hydrolase
MIETAKLITEKAFKGKTDKAGAPYFEHLERVKNAMEERYSRDHELLCIAYLHDLLEDCPEWNEKSLRVFFTDRIVDAVVVLTHSKVESYESYITRVLENSDAKLVKVYDLRDNMDITRLPELTENDMRRLYKYHQAYKRLTT